MVNYIRAMMEQPMRPWFLTRLAIYIVSIIIGINYDFASGFVFLLFAMTGYALGFISFVCGQDYDEEGGLIQIDKSTLLKRYEEFLNNEMVHSTDMGSNGDLDHATILLKTFIRHTHNVIKFYERNFGGRELDKKIMPYLKQFLEGGGELRVLIPDDDISDDTITYLKQLHECEKHNIVVKHAYKNDVTRFTRDWGEEPSFQFFDSTGMRYEYDAENYKSYYSFNIDVAPSQHSLFRRFEDMYNNATLIDINEYGESG